MGRKRGGGGGRGRRRRNVLIPFRVMEAQIGFKSRSPFPSPSLSLFAVETSDVIAEN